MVEQVVREGESYPEAPDRGYFLGTAAIPILLAAHHHVAQGVGLEAADVFLAEALRGLATMLGKETGRKVEIRMSTTGGR